MTVLVQAKKTFTQYEYDNVTNIAYDGTNYVLTLTGGSVTYSASSYIIHIIY